MFVKICQNQREACKNFEVLVLIVDSDCIISKKKAKVVSLYFWSLLFKLVFISPLPDSNPFPQIFQYFKVIFIFFSIRNFFQEKNWYSHLLHI